MNRRAFLKLGGLFAISPPVLAFQTEKSKLKITGVRLVRIRPKRPVPSYTPAPGSWSTGGVEVANTMSIYPEYKANRAEMPEDLRPQVPMIRELTLALNIPIVELAGYEADDVMGTLARQASRAGLPSVIVSPDKDLLQLVDDPGRIQVLNNRDGEVWIDRAGVKERFGVWPEQVVDVLTLMGDASDNVKGVEGIGEKGARDLVEQYGNLDAIVEHRTELKRKAHREGLEAALERLPLVRRLVTVVTDLELPVTLDDLSYKGVDQAQARAAFKALGFEQLTKEFTGTGPAASAGAARTYRAASTLVELEAAVAAFREAGPFGLDTETTSIDPTRGHLVGLSLAWKPNEGLYVPLAHLKPGTGDTEGALPGLLPDSGLPEALLDLSGDPAAFFDQLGIGAGAVAAARGCHRNTAVGVVNADVQRGRGARRAGAVGEHFAGGWRARSARRAGVDLRAGGTAFLRRTSGRASCGGRRGGRAEFHGRGRGSLRGRR